MASPQPWIDYGLPAYQESIISASITLAFGWMPYFYPSGCLGSYFSLAFPINDIIFWMDDYFRTYKAKNFLFILASFGTEVLTILQMVGFCGYGLSQSFAQTMYYVNTYIFELIKLIGYADSVMDTIFMQDWVMLGYYSDMFLYDFIF